MSDRFQFGDNCYETPLQAAQAQLAAQSPYPIVHDFGDGVGPIAAVVSPVRAHAEDGVGEEWYSPGSFEYAITATHNGEAYATDLSVPYYPQVCVLDEALMPGQVTPATATVALAFGLGAVLSMWAIGYVLGLATGLIRKA